jgi:hypothetical protein
MVSRLRGERDERWRRRRPRSGEDEAAALISSARVAAALGG